MEQELRSLETKAIAIGTGSKRKGQVLSPSSWHPLLAEPDQAKPKRGLQSPRQGSIKSGCVACTAPPPKLQLLQQGIRNNKSTYPIACYED